jgi:hypothetical protein
VAAGSGRSRWALGAISVQTIRHKLRQSVFAFSVCALLSSCSPPALKDGREFGYYGDFNRVSNALVSIPGVVVTNFWMNRDITLEEFGFDVTTGAGKSVHIALGERDPLRRMHRAELVSALQKELGAH